MHKFNYTKRSLWNGSHLIGAILICAGLIILVTSFFINQETDQLTLTVMVGCFLFLGLLIMSTFTGKLLDFKDSKIKNYQSVLWIKFGEWQPLPVVDKVDLILHSYRSSGFSNGISPSISYDITVFKVVLIGQNTLVMNLDYSSQKKASKALEELKKGFGLV